MHRTLIVESKTEDRHSTIYELRHVNSLPLHDDRFTVVVPREHPQPAWAVGESVDATLGEE